MGSGQLGMAWSLDLGARSLDHRSTSACRVGGRPLDSAPGTLRLGTRLLALNKIMNSKADWDFQSAFFVDA